MNNNSRNSASTLHPKNLQKGMGYSTTALAQFPIPLSVTENTVPRFQRLLFRITLFLFLVSLGAPLPQFAQTQDKPHRVVKNYPLNRQKLEHLQHWVDAGHDSWCRHSDLVAAATLEQLAPNFASFEYTPTSAKVASQKHHSSVASYTYYSVDGQQSYRITVRRFRWLHPSTHSAEDTIWVPVRAEIITRALTD